jgi:hypothetical protein
MHHRSNARLLALLAAGTLAPAASAQCPPAELFGPATPYATGSLPLGIAVGDVSGDGIPDIVTANFFENTITILRGNGDGTFQAGADVIMVPKGSKDIVGPVQPAVGDLNGDGANDIVIGVNNQIGILLNDGKGHFTGPPNYVGFGAMVRGVVIANFTADKVPDVAFSSRDDGTLNILVGNGDGTFQDQHPLVLGGGPVGAVVRDFNNDGNLDVATPLVFDGQVLIAYGDGNGYLNEGPRYPVGSPEWLEGGDVNNDGITDLATAFLNGDAVQVLIGNPDGSFQDAVTVGTGAGSLPITVNLADVNGDGFDDVLAAAFIANQVAVRLSNGDGTFQDAVPFPVGPRPRRFAIADLNNDGALDIAAANGATDGSATVVLGRCIPSPGCAADWNTDGTLNSQDFFDFLVDFFAGAADYNHDLTTNSQDFFDFVTSFFVGC